MIKLCVLASGSKGNCTYISDGKTSVLVDIGLSYKTLNFAATQAEIDLNSVSAILNTHNHTDHCKGIKTFLNKHDIPVFSHNAGRLPLAKTTGINENKIKGFDKSFNIGTFTVKPFLVSHDAPICCGYSINNGISKVCIATDLGKTDDTILENFYKSDICVIESNHDIQMLKNSSYPYCLKKRILSEYGHLSNEDAAIAIEKIVNKGSKNFILAHLSEENNLPELAFSCISDYLNKRNIKEGRECNIAVASQYKSTKMFCV